MFDAHLMIERRKFERTNIDILANLVPKVYFPNDPTPYQVLNFSFTGLFIKEQTNYKKGEVVNIELEIPAIGKIPMSIYIIQINLSEPKGCGVEIFKIPPKYKKIWAQFIKICHSLTEVKKLYQKLQNELNK
jgi:hypothetical protein